MQVLSALPPALWRCWVRGPAALARHVATGLLLVPRLLASMPRRKRVVKQVLKPSLPCHQVCLPFDNNAGVGIAASVRNSASILPQRGANGAEAAPAPARAAAASPPPAGAPAADPNLYLVPKACFNGSCYTGNVAYAEDAFVVVSPGVADLGSPNLAGGGADTRYR